jgi:hypothetical protein
MVTATIRRNPICFNRENFRLAFSYERNKADEGHRRLAHQPTNCKSAGGRFQRKADSNVVGQPDGYYK